MKCSLGISNFLEEISSLSHSTVFLYLFALITEDGFLLSPCSSLELFIQMGISFPFSFAFCFSSLHSYFAFLYFFFSCTMSQTPSLVHQTLYQRQIVDMYIYLLCGLVTNSCWTLVILWTVACQAPLSMGISRQEYWCCLLFPSPGNLPNQEIKPRSPTLQADDLQTEMVR